MTLQELKGKRKTLVRRCRGILDKAEDAKRDLTGDEEAETDRLMAEAEGLQLRIKSGEIKKAGEIVDEAPRMQGRSLLPIMTGKADSSIHKSHIVCDFNDSLGYSPVKTQTQATITFDGQIAGPSCSQR